MPGHRLLIVSNRLPVTARVDARGLRLVPSSGGLATGLRPWHERSGGVWIGWPGDVSSFAADQRAELDRKLQAARLVPVALSPAQVAGHYHGFANRVLWPLFHYLLDKIPVETEGWSTYQQVNEAFADAVVREYRPGDTIWVHDYHLMLTPALLRQHLPDARIGFFLHIPFPSSEIFRTLPWRRDVLDGILGADLVGFHTVGYLRHFLSSLLHIAGIDAELDRVQVADRAVKVGVFPMGIDAARFSALAQDPDVIAEAKAIRQDAGDRQIILGVDRLDYTKGIPRRLHAIERLLDRKPALRDRIRYIQVAVPSRGEIDPYRRFKQQVEERVGRINGACGTLRSAPVHYLHRSITARQLVALYRAADVMLVTPLRDGMNLVAKEFVASRVDEDGALVLSELAGAAAELDGAVSVNPYDVDAIGDSVDRALSLPAMERRTRMAGLRQHVLSHDVHAWASEFLRQLESARAGQPALAPAADLGSSRGASILESRQTGALRLLLDYDGTLVPFARFPELAQPDPELLFLLDSLARSSRIRVEIVSGRPRLTLHEWFGELPIALWAEHGLWHRAGPGQVWRHATRIAPDWVNGIAPILDRFAAHTPGSHVEKKSASIAWHYRTARSEFGTRQAHELRMLLGMVLSNQPLEVLDGNKVIEVRPRGVSKALAAHRADLPAADTTILAIGDDRTDEELFRALPPDSLTIAVGRRAMHARYRVDDCQAVRRMLWSLVDADTGKASEKVRTVSISR